MSRPRTLLVATVGLLLACGGESPTSSATERPGSVEPPASTEPLAMVTPNMVQGAVVGVPFRYDASRGSTAFSDPRRTGLSYAISGLAAGLTAVGGTISGTPVAPAVLTVTVTARDASGYTAAQSFPIVVFAADVAAPSLPAGLLAYGDARAPLPRHFTNAATAAGDNMPATNPTTDAGATLGRVLFYDRRLSANDRVACASCHVQSAGFADTARLSRGFAGALTSRHSMALNNARWYERGRFFWDERAATLEDQVLAPVQDSVEMGLTLPQLVTKLEATPFYAPLFTAAFGSAEVTSERVARALAQFVRSLVSANSRFDFALTRGTQGAPAFATVLTAEEQEGMALYNGRGACGVCHGTNAHVSDGIHNNGLDARTVDAGAAAGRFKAPSLRNVAVRGRYMHDGRFTSLEQVVDFYDRGTQNSTSLDPRLRAADGTPRRLDLTAQERAALLAFLRTLTDSTFLTDPRFGSPFRP